MSKTVSREAAKIAKISAIRDALALISENGWHCRPVDSGVAYLGSVHGFTIRLGAHTNTIRYRGISASCTWSKQHGLINAWRWAASRWLEKNA